MCTNNQCESEVYFLLHCKCYNDIQSDFIPKVRNKYILFIYTSEYLNLRILINGKWNIMINDIAKFTYKGCIKEELQYVYVRL